jgi:hypothetical protein
MAKGLFTQGVCVLLRSPVEVPKLLESLRGFELVGRHDSDGDDESPSTLVYRYKEEFHGHLLVTPSSEPWPDDLGDPESSPEKFIAWSLGQFSPLAFPGCLQRAGEQCWGWEEGTQAITEHSAHVRLLMSYVLGPDEPDKALASDVPLMPAEYDPIDELKFLTRAVEAVLELPQAICYFNPGGEVLRDSDGLRRGLNHAWNHQLPPLDMWTNVRLFRVSEQWTMMDTVGNSQFDIPDVEAIFDTQKYEPSEIEGFLRSASLYLIEGAEEVEDGDTADGPGSISWMAMECADGLSDPPRETIRWIPQDNSQPPEELLDPGLDDEELFDEDDEELLSDEELDEDIDDYNEFDGFDNEEDEDDFDEDDEDEDDRFDPGDDEEDDDDDDQPSRRDPLDR